MIRQKDQAVKMTKIRNDSSDKSVPLANLNLNQTVDLFYTISPIIMALETVTYWSLKVISYFAVATNLHLLFCSSTARQAAVTPV